MRRFIRSTLIYLTGATMCAGIGACLSYFMLVAGCRISGLYPPLSRLTIVVYSVAGVGATTGVIAGAWGSACLLHFAERGRCRPTGRH
jgi:hypothetical protein